LLKDIRNLIDIQIGALFIVDEKTNDFNLEAVEPFEKGHECCKEIEFQIECGMFSWIIKRRKVSIIPSFVFRNKSTIVMMPLGTMKRTLGLVLIVVPVEEGLITQENMRLLSMLSKECSLVMENAFLYESLRKKHETLQKAQEQIVRSEKLSSLGKLTSGASHEILNPLNIISGNIQLLLMDKCLDSRVAKSLHIMKDQSGRIANIINSLLEFSQKTKSEIKPVNINDIFEKVLLLAGYQIRFDTIDIVKDYDHNLPSVMGDEEKLVQALFNLLSNASDSMPNGGFLKIFARVLDYNDRFIEIKFQDTGCGILKENINKIFDPFFSTKESENDTGIGLSVTYGIIHDHGGSIKVESMVDKGSTFTILLPAGSA
jgi:signal transduction histidine kinase